jgi:hypothetical protein
MLGLLLCALVVRHSLVAYTSTSGPPLEDLLPISSSFWLGKAVRATQSETDALGRLEGFAKLPLEEDAKTVASTPSIPAEPSQITSWYFEALRRHPLSGRAFVGLGQLEVQSGDKARAQALYEASVKRTIRQRAGLAWLLAREYDAGNNGKALFYADALLRVSPQQVRVLSPLLGHIAEAPESAEPFIDLLKQDPAWRAGFFGSLKGAVSDARTPMKLLLALKPTAHPPARSELQSYIAFLLEHKLYELAYSVWLQFLPPENLRVAGFLYNGSFDLPSDTYPFDWNVGREFRFERALRADKQGSSALRVDFSGARTGTQVLSQMIMLLPGRYTLTGSTRNDVKARRGLRWSIACATGGNPLGESEVLASASSWTTFELSFTVPKENCRAQWVRLVVEARSGSETMMLGSLLIDDLIVQRATN